MYDQTKYYYTNIHNINICPSTNLHQVTLCLRLSHKGKDTTIQQLLYFTNAKPYWVISASQQQVKKRWVSASAKYFLSGKKNLVADSENLTVCIEKVKFFCRDNNCPVTLKHSVYVNTDNVIEITAKDF